MMQAGKDEFEEAFFCGYIEKEPYEEEKSIEESFVGRSRETMESVYMVDGHENIVETDHFVPKEKGYNYEEVRTEELGPSPGVPPLSFPEP